MIEAPLGGGVMSSGAREIVYTNALAQTVANLRVYSDLARTVPVQTTASMTAQAGTFVAPTSLPDGTYYTAVTVTYLDGQTYDDVNDSFTLEPDFSAKETLLWTPPAGDPTAVPNVLRIYTDSTLSTLLVTASWRLVNGRYAATFPALPQGTYWQRLGFTGAYGTDSSDGPLTLPVAQDDSNYLVTLDELAQRLGITPNSGRALSLLERASNRVRSYGDPSWTHTTAPGVVRDIALDFAERAYNNPRTDLTSQSTGSVSESYNGTSGGLTAAEIKDIRRASGRPSVSSLRLKSEIGTSVLTRRGYFEDCR